MKMAFSRLLPPELETTMKKEIDQVNCKTFQFKLRLFLL